MKALFLLFCLIGCIAACNARGPSNFITVSDQAGSVALENVAVVAVADNLLILPPNETGLAKMEVGSGVVSNRPPNAISVNYVNSGQKNASLSGLEYSGRNSLNSIQGGVQIKESGFSFSTEAFTGDAYYGFSQTEMMLNNTNEFAIPDVLMANLESENVMMQENIVPIAEITVLKSDMTT